MASGSVDMMKKVARWTGLIAGILTIVVGLVHIFSKSAYIKWPQGGFISDVNEDSWRRALFSFAPEVFVDSWTPFVFGLVATLCHFKQFEIKCITGTFLRYFLFMFVLGMFASIGYAGGLGILFSIPVWFCCLLSLVIAVLDEDRANLELSIQLKN